MKKILIAVGLFSAIIFAACNSGNNQTDKTADKIADTSQSTIPETSNDSGQANTMQANSRGSIKEIVIGYLQIKNALANDDGKEAANGGKAMVDAMQKFNKSSLSPEQQKAYDDMASAMRENAEHIGENADKIAHQREHFDMLSQDMADMVKTFNAGETLYKDYCPMYNNEKGAVWISETKEIKNPYLGKKMSTCGEVKEEIKQ